MGADEGMLILLTMRIRKFFTWPPSQHRGVLPDQGNVNI